MTPKRSSSSAASWLVLVWFLALLACARCATLTEAEPQEIDRLRRENATLRSQLQQCEDDVSSCSDLLKDCEALGSDH